MMLQKWTRGRCHCKVETYFLCWGILSNVSRSTLYPASLGYSAMVGVVIHWLTSRLDRACNSIGVWKQWYENGGGGLEWHSVYLGACWWQRTVVHEDKWTDTFSMGKGITSSMSGMGIEQGKVGRCTYSIGNHVWNEEVIHPHTAMFREGESETFLP